MRLRARMPEWERARAITRGCAEWHTPGFVSASPRDRNTLVIPWYRGQTGSTAPVRAEGGGGGGPGIGRRWARKVGSRVDGVAPREQRRLHSGRLSRAWGRASGAWTQLRVAPPGPAEPAAVPVSSLLAGPANRHTRAGLGSGGGGH